MKKRIIAIIAILVFALTVLPACAKQNYDFVGKTYIYEKLIGDNAFSITIKEDGTYSYTEGTERSKGFAKSCSYYINIFI